MKSGVLKMRRSPAILVTAGLLIAVAQAPVGAQSPVDELRSWLSEHPFSPSVLADLNRQPFADLRLTRQQAQECEEVLWEARAQRIRTERAAEMEAGEVTIGELTMPFRYRVFGDKPKSGRSLFISMHGGGGAPAAVNDQQYRNQQRLYEPEEGVYLAPRAPTDTWNLWHQAHIDRFFDRLITNMVVFEDVNPDRVFLMGYSAGGDGVYQLAPRLADRFAAAAMMAGHPNETQPDGLRNLPFTIHMGELDGAYDRNRIAGEWKQKLAALRENDPGGYPHLVTIHEGRGHWMNRQDAVALPWMAANNRKRFPDRVVWRQDDVVHDRFYWLRTVGSEGPDRALIDVAHAGNTFRVLHSDAAGIELLLHDNFIDIDQPVKVTRGDSELFSGAVKRRISTIAETLLDRDEPGSVAYATITVALPNPPVSGR